MNSMTNFSVVNANKINEDSKLSYYSPGSVSRKPMYAMSNGVILQNKENIIKNIYIYTAKPYYRN